MIQVGDYVRTKANVPYLSPNRQNVVVQVVEKGFIGLNPTIKVMFHDGPYTVWAHDVEEVSLVKEDNPFTIPEPPKKKPVIKLNVRAEPTEEEKNKSQELDWTSLAQKLVNFGVPWAFAVKIAKNCKEMKFYNMAIQRTTPANVLNYAFSWANTLEGSAYWSSVHKRFLAGNFQQP